MIDSGSSTPYDLEDRTFRFAKSIRLFVKIIPKTIGNFEDIKQLVRSSGSVGANYIEANDSLSKKDFIMRVKISRKEAKETIYWLKLLDCGDDANITSQQKKLIQEAQELMMILGAILRNSSNNPT